MCHNRRRHSSMTSQNCHVLPFSFNPFPIQIFPIKNVFFEFWFLEEKKFTKAGRGVIGQDLAVVVVVFVVVVVDAAVVVVIVVVVVDAAAVVVVV